jgi:hypothetical protein
MNRHHGSSFTVKWLKACAVALQRYLGNDRVASLRDIEPGLPLPRVSRGIPSIIPSADRSRIRRGDSKTIQFWLTAFGLYRVIVCPFVSKLQTITDAFSGSISYLARLESDVANSPIVNRFRLLPGWDDWHRSLNIAPSTVKFIQSSSPSNSIAWHGLLLDAYLIDKSQVSGAFYEYIRLIKADVFKEKFSEALSLIDRMSKKTTLDPTLFLSFKNSWEGGIGQLAFKEEAAGKLRAFALVDVWTQSLLHPLHQALFDLLRLIPNDATFDQDASVARSVDKASHSGAAFSFDLSAATDRLPLSLQAALLNKFLGNNLGSLWAEILVGREYSIPEKSRENYTINVDTVRYAVGQPMGALSSWAMLAITHHFLVQYASMKCGRRGWELGYEILGDDLVIFDKELADSYLEVVRGIGVEINLSKSISSPKLPVFEFAKRTVTGSIHVSGVSWVQFISEASIGSRVANIMYFAARGQVRSNSVLMILLSRFGKFKSATDLNLPLLSLLGGLFSRKQVSLKDIITAMIDPHNEEFDFTESPFSLPTQSLLTATKGLLNRSSDSLDLPNRNVELFEELEADITASVLLQALAIAKALENDWDRITESFKSNTRYIVRGWGEEGVDDPELAFSSFMEEVVWDSVNPELSSRLENLISPPGVCGGYAYKLVRDDNPAAKAILLNDRILVSALDGWVLDLIMDGSDLDISDLVDSVESVAYNHAKYCNFPLDDAIQLLDDIQNVRRRFDLVDPSREELAPLGSVSPGQVFTWLARSQELMSRKGYLVERLEAVNL